MHDTPQKRVANHALRRIERLSSHLRILLEAGVCRKNIHMAGLEAINATDATEHAELTRLCLASATGDNRRVVGNPARPPAAAL